MLFASMCQLAIRLMPTFGGRARFDKLLAETDAEGLARTGEGDGKRSKPVAQEALDILIGLPWRRCFE